MGEIKVRLRHWDLLMAKELDMKLLMEELDGFAVPRFGKGKAFVSSYARVSNLVESLSTVDVGKLGRSDSCELEPPEHIDGISFMAMMELQSLIGDSSSFSFSEYVANYISICCFGKVYSKKKFNRDGKRFKRLVKRVLDMDGFEMVGLYNELSEKVLERSNYWDKAFFQVSHSDGDYIAAGGDRMKAFNVIETLKSLCADFNVSIEEAWQLPYSLSQVNSLSSATKADIERNLSEIKERKFRAQKKR